LANQSRRNDEGQSNSVKDEIARMHKNPRLGEWGSQWVSNGTIRKSDGGFL